MCCHTLHLTYVQYTQSTSQYVWYIATEDMKVTVCHLPPDSVAPSHVNIEHALELVISLFLRTDVNKALLELLEGK